MGGASGGVEGSCPLCPRSCPQLPPHVPGYQGHMPWYNLPCPYNLGSEARCPQQRNNPGDAHCRKPLKYRTLASKSHDIVCRWSLASWRICCCIIISVETLTFQWMYMDRKLSNNASALKEPEIYRFSTKCNLRLSYHHIYHSALIFI